MSEERKRQGRPKGCLHTGGRKPGTPNKPKPLKQWVTKLIEEHQERFKEDLLELEPKDRVAILEKMLNYALPKMKAIEFQDNENASMMLLIQRTAAFHRAERDARLHSQDDGEDD